MSTQIEAGMSGADLLAALLVNHEVSTVFCISGAGNLAIIDALQKYETVNIIYSHHEQAAVMEAQGYSRISGKVGVALVTTGGGSSNAVTGILSAYLDSVPVLIISGNESSFHCRNMADFRAFGTQGFDSCAVVKPMTKSATRIMDTTDIEILFRSAWSTVQTNRPGPALLDFPMDIQRSKVTLQNSIATASPVEEEFRITPAVIQSYQECLNDLAAAQRPLLYFGNGVRQPKTRDLMNDLIETLQVPFLLSWSAIDLFPDEHPLNVGRVGIYGDRAANIILQKCDLLICVGTRLSIPQTGYDKNDFAREATKWVIDIDPIELKKFPTSGWRTICASAESFFNEALRSSAKPEMQSASEWKKEIVGIKNQLPRDKQIGQIRFGKNEVHSFEVISEINRQMSGNSTVVTDVGAGLLTGHYAFTQQCEQRMFTSQGLGEMGFGLPGAIGAYFADPKRQLICLNTDGGIMFNLQELQVVSYHKIPIKLFIFNNAGYSMIRISQENLFASRFAGISAETGVSFPDFSDVARTFGFAYKNLDDSNLIESIVSETLTMPGPVLIDVRMSPSQKYFPRLATATMPDGSFISPPLEDLDPKLPLELLENLLGYEPLEASVAIRKGQM